MNKYKYLAEVMFLVVILTSASSFAKSSTVLSCLTDGSKMHISVRLVNNKIELAKIMEEKSTQEVSIEKAKVVNSEKYFSLTGQVNKKSFRLAVNLESQDIPNGKLSFTKTSSKDKTQNMNCYYSETGLNI
jgi:hypothetical protein